MASNTETKDLTLNGSNADPPATKTCYCYHISKSPDGKDEGSEHGRYIAHRTYREPPGFKPEYSRCPKCVSDEKKRLVVARLMSADIPPRFQGRLLDRSGKPFVIVNDGQKKVKGVADRYIQNFDERLHEGGGLIFAGLPGTGKSHLSCFILESVIKQHDARGFYTTEYQILKKIKSTWRRDAEESEDGIIESLILPHLLVIDEIGVAALSGNDRAIMHEVIDRRYQAEMKPVIAVGNLTLEEMNEHLGDRIMDRLKDGGGVALAFDWKSLRE